MDTPTARPGHESRPRQLAGHAHPVRGAHRRRGRRHQRLERPRRLLHVPGRAHRRPREHPAAAGDRVRHRGDGRRSGRRRRRRHVRGLRGLGQQPQPLAARPLLRVAVRGVRVRVLPRGRLARAAPDPRDRELGLRVPGDRVPRERRAARRGQPVREQPRAPAPRHHRPRSLRVHEHDRDHRQHLPQQPRVRPGGGGRIQPSGRLLRAQATSGAIAVVEGATRRPRRGGGWRRARRGRGRRPRQRQQTAPRPTARRRRPPRPRPR